MSSPVVIRGTPVSNPHQATTTMTNQAHGLGSRVPEQPPTGERSSSGCKDPIFAVLWYICILAIVAVAVVYGPKALKTGSNNSNVNYSGFVVGVVVIAVVSFILAAAGMSVMMCIPETMIKVALIFSLVMSFVWMVMSFLSGMIGLGVVGVIFFLLSVCYTWAVWSRIPFASTNLVTAITAVKANIGVCGYAYGITVLAGAWSFTWSVAFVGIFDKTYTCDAQNVCTNPNYGYLFLLFLAYFFGQQVFQVCCVWN
jgi:hypothetical protein